MSKQYTPGPWSTYLNTMDDVIIRKLNASGYEQCVIARGVDYTNARLIAAAPDLLGALKAVLNNCLDSQGLADAYKQARAAIAKAEGGAA